MALSDYLSDDEWDACYYASFGQHASSNFWESMYKTIEALSAAGYEFDGLYADGTRKTQVSSRNPSKLLIFLGNPNGVDILGILDSGRAFLKKHLPSLVDETDEEWAEQLASAATQLTRPPRAAMETARELPVRYRMN